MRNAAQFWPTKRLFLLQFNMYLKKKKKLYYITRHTYILFNISTAISPPSLNLKCLLFCFIYLEGNWYPRPLSTVFCVNDKSLEMHTEITNAKMILLRLFFFSCSDYFFFFCSDYFCSIAKSCPTLCGLMDCGMSAFLILHHLLEFAQTHVHWVRDAI